MPLSPAWRLSHPQGEADTHAASLVLTNSSNKGPAHVGSSALGNFPSPPTDKELTRGEGIQPETGEERASLPWTEGHMIQVGREGVW